MVAVGPVTPKKNMILAENIPDTIQLFFVERNVFPNAVSDPNRHLGKLDEDARILAE